MPHVTEMGVAGAAIANAALGRAIAERDALAADVGDLRRELATWQQAMGLASTAVPGLEMEPDHPLQMAQLVVEEAIRLRRVIDILTFERDDVVAERDALAAELAAIKAELPDILDNASESIRDAFSLGSKLANQIDAWAARLRGEGK